MKTRFLISPAYLLSIVCLIAGAVMAGTALMVIGWIIFVVGLGINVMALVVLANREELYKAQNIGSTPKAQPAQPAPTGSRNTPALPRPAQTPPSSPPKNKNTPKTQGESSP